jgi:pimeloyl-ACP methyl ester carboxylesterase
MSNSQFQDEYVQADGVRLHCVRFGAGPLMLFLHGFPEFWYAWKYQLAEFGGDHLAVAADLRGYNLSDKPAELDQYRIDRLVEDVCALGDYYSHGKKFVLIGHDWGGVLAWIYAGAHADRLEKLIIINAPHPAIFSRLLVSDPAQQSASQYMLFFRSPQAEETLAANNHAWLVSVVMSAGLASGAFTEEDKSAYLDAWSQPGALVGGLNYYRANRLGPQLGGDASKALSTNNFGLDPTTPPIPVPTLVIWGEKDAALTKQNLNGLEQFVPQLTIQRIPEATHWVVHERRSEVNTYIRNFVR